MYLLYVLNVILSMFLSLYLFMPSSFLNHSFCAYFVTPIDKLIVHCSYIVYSAIGERAGAHIRLPHGPPKGLQASVEVCRRTPCLFPPTWSRPEELSSLRVYPNGLTFQIQVMICFCFFVFFFFFVSGR